MNSTPQRNAGRHETDYTFARLPCAFLHDPRLARLTAAARWVYVATYLYATEKRLRTLPPHLADTASIAAVTRTDQRTASRALQSCSDVGLVCRTPEDGLTIANIEEYAHGNMVWRDGQGGEIAGEMSGNSRKKNRIEKNRSREEAPSGTGQAEAPARPASGNTPATLAAILPDLSTDRRTAAESACEPDAAEVEKQTQSLVQFAAERRKCCGLATGTASKLGNSHLLERCLAELSEVDFLAACGYVTAWRLANPGRADAAPGVLIQRFKRHLSAEVTP